MYNPADLALEIKINAAEREFAREPSKDNWETLAALIFQRSPERVVEMEERARDRADG